MEEFSRAFTEADELVITDIYSPPGEPPIAGVTSERLAQMVRENSNPNTVYRATKEDVELHLLQHARPGDLVITMGVWGHLARGPQPGPRPESETEGESQVREEQPSAPGGCFFVFG